MINIQIDHKAFGDSEVLRDIHFQIPKGQTVALLGPSGIGKTTLLRIVAGLDDDFDGTVSRPDELAMVFQEPNLLPWRSCLQNITLTTGASDQKALDAMAEVGLSGKSGDFPGQLSLGQRRRLALARAFSANPKLLIMDEPFASLDEKRISEMVDLTQRLIAATGVTTLLVTHSEFEATQLADKVLRIDGHPAGLVGTQ